MSDEVPRIGQICQDHEQLRFPQKGKRIGFQDEVEDDPIHFEKGEYEEEADANFEEDSQDNIEEHKPYAGPMEVE